MSYKMTGLNKYSARLRSESKRIEDEGEKIAADAAEFGANLMRQFIQTRSTKTGLMENREGRVKTAVMLNSVGVGQPRKLKNGVSVSFGWGVNGTKTEDYFFFQEIGAGRIPPMHALLDSLVRTREYFYARIKEVV